jgi:glycosyltransferase involved in cell wall biosynthesis
MSVYNGQRFLEAAVRSILAQTMTDLELIVVDDGSTDRSLAILQSIAAEDERVKIISRPNTGIAQALNEGLAIARGEFIAKMDADDVSIPDRFEKQVAFLRAHPEVVVVAGAWEMIDECDRLLTRLNGPENDAEIQAMALTGHSPITHSCAMMRTDVLKSVGGYDTRFRYALDLDLWLRLGEIGKLANLRDVMVKFRLHAGSISETKRTEQRQMAKRACEAAWKRRGIQGEFTAQEPWRPGKDRASRHHYALLYGWWAWNYGQRKTAIHYGARALLAQPWKLDGL